MKYEGFLEKWLLGGRTHSLDKSLGEGERYLPLCCLPRRICLAGGTKKISKLVALCGNRTNSLYEVVASLQVFNEI